MRIVENPQHHFGGCISIACMHGERWTSRSLTEQETWVVHGLHETARGRPLVLDDIPLGCMHALLIELPHLIGRPIHVQVDGDVRLRLICHAANDAAIRWKRKGVREIVWKGPKV